MYLTKEELAAAFPHMHADDDAEGWQYGGGWEG